jgi:hypothetical protein
MSYFGTMLLFGGILIIIFVMVRLMMKNRDISAKYKKEALSIEEKRAMMKAKTEANDFGQKLKWSVEIDDGKKDRPSGGAKPPAGRGR